MPDLQDERQLIRADQYIVEIEGRLAHQLARRAWLSAKRRDTRLAEEFVSHLRHNLEHWREHRKSLLEILARD